VGYFGPKLSEFGGDPIAVLLGDSTDLHIHDGCRLITGEPEPFAQRLYRVFRGAGSLDNFEDLAPLGLSTR
jgi:hypothetical protein